jgi:hypothetical protein
MQSRDIAPQDVIDPKAAKARTNDLFDNTAVFARCAGFEVDRDVVLQEAVGETVHGRGRAGPPFRFGRVCAAGHATEDLPRPLPRLVWGESAVDPNFDPALAALLAVLDEIGFTPRGQDPDPESLEHRVPSEVIAGAGLQGVEGTFGEFHRIFQK